MCAHQRLRSACASAESDQSLSSIGALWEARGLMFLQEKNKDSDQTVRMRRLTDLNLRCTLYVNLYLMLDTGSNAQIFLHARIQRGDRGSRPPPENHKLWSLFTILGPDLLKNHKTTKPAFNVPSSSPRLASETLFADGPMTSRFIAIWILSPLIKTKQIHTKNIRVGPPLAKLSGSAHVLSQMAEINHVVHICLKLP